jgi:predicted O-methyltransferase YrrM
MKTKTYHKLIEEKSFEALPTLLKRNKDKVDLVFVDGWHTFDYTLVDIFYGVLLLRIGGYLIIDDALHPGVANTLKYLDTNYIMLKRKTSPRSFGVYQKIQDDTRDWDFHKKF